MQRDVPLLNAGDLVLEMALDGAQRRHRPAEGVERLLLGLVGRAAAAPGELGGARSGRELAGDEPDHLASAGDALLDGLGGRRPPRQVGNDGDVSLVLRGLDDDALAARYLYVLPLFSHRR